MFKLTRIYGRHSVTHKQMTDAIRFGLDRETHCNVYPFRERQQEAATIARLRPRTGNVENIVPFHPRSEPTRPAA